jgi:hypothetical protein
MTSQERETSVEAENEGFGRWGETESLEGYVGDGPRLEFSKQ